MSANKSIENALSLIKADSSKVLGLKIGTYEVIPGQRIRKADAQNPPQLILPSGTGTYLVIGLDIDAPFPSFGVLGPILHWIQPGLKSQPSADGSFLLSSTDTPFVANYIGPAPPPGSGPHRYVFLLYDQPAEFDGKKYATAGGEKMGNWQRMRYDLGAFEAQANLGPVIAANYFCAN